MNKELPVLAITMGDPSGIGPEIIVKSLNEKSVYEICKPLVVGDADVMNSALKIADSSLKVRAVKNVDDAEFKYGVIDVIDLNCVDISELQHGKVQAVSGRAAYLAVEKAIQLALNNEVDGTITSPLNKEAMNKAGYHYSGHTEIYADLTNTKNYTMMLADGPLRVVHVSTHVPLRKACDLVKKDRVLKVIELANEIMEDLGISNPHIGVAGLNPHAGENGLFGWEEEKEISPAIAEAKGKGLNVEGPVAPDTLFSKAKGGQYDIVVINTMTKTILFKVQVSFGMKVVRNGRP